MWQTVVIFGTAFATLTRLGVEANFHFRDLKAVTDMFVDCDTFILSDSGLPHNINEVSQPIMLYEIVHKFIALGIIAVLQLPDIGYQQYSNPVWYFKKKHLLFSNTFHGRNCKAQILIFTRSLKLEENLSLEMLSAFRPDESVYRYTVVIHQDDYELKKKTVVLSIPYFYRVSMACNDEQDSDYYSLAASMGPAAIAHHYSGWTVCHLNDFKIVCLFCKVEDIVEYDCNQDKRKTCPIEIAKESQRDGSIAINERPLNLVHHNELFYMLGLRLESSMLYLAASRPEKDQSSRLNFRKIIKSVKSKFGLSAVFTKLNELIFPEEIFLDSVLTHHQNATCKEISQDTPPFGLNILTGPGVPDASMIFFAKFVPIGTSGISFLTCSNISLVARDGIFSAPFDVTTWIWTLASVILVSMTLLMAMKKWNLVVNFFLVMYVVVRLLLDNHGGVSRQHVRRSKLMAFLTCLMALATIILSNGYKGVLTSDLAMDPVPVANLTFEQILASNWMVGFQREWSIGRKQHIPKQEEIAMQYSVKTSLILWALVTNFSLLAYDVSEAEKFRKNHELDFKALDIAIKLNLVSMEWRYCKDNYWLFEKGTFSRPEIPTLVFDRNMSAIPPFFVSEERVATRIISWGSFREHPGPVFTSIRRGIEAGLHHWLNKIRREVNLAGVYFKDNFMMHLLKKEPKALTRETVLVSSTLWLYLVLSLIAIVVLVGELAWKHKKSISFWIRECSFAIINATIQPAVQFTRLFRRKTEPETAVEHKVASSPL